MPNLPKPRSGVELYLAAILHELRAQRPPQVEVPQSIEPPALDTGEIRLEEPATPGGQAARPDPEAKCAGTTTLGRPCRRNPVEGSAFCATHQPEQEG